MEDWKLRQSARLRSAGQMTEATDELLQRGSFSNPSSQSVDAEAFRLVVFSQSDESEILVQGPEDLSLITQIADLLNLDRSLGCGALDEQRVYVLFREPLGDVPGRILVADRRAVEAVVRAEFGERVTRKEIQLILQTLAGLSLQICAVRDRVSIETKKSQSKALLSKLGFPDLGHLRAVLMAQISGRVT